MRQSTTVATCTELLKRYHNPENVFSNSINPNTRHQTRARPKLFWSNMMFLMGSALLPGIGKADMHLFD
jgi:hypothetical protein